MKIIIPAVMFLISGCASMEEKKESPSDDAFRSVMKSMDGEPVVPREANRLYIRFSSGSPAWKSITDRLVLKISENITGDGRLAVVPEENSTDLKLEGKVTDCQIQNLKFEPGGRPVLRRMRITVSVRMTDLMRKKVIFFEKGIQSFREFSDVKPPITLEPQVQEEVLDNLAKRISSKAVTGWYTKYMTPAEKGEKK